MERNHIEAYRGSMESLSIAFEQFFRQKPVLIESDGPGSVTILHTLDTPPSENALEVFKREYVSPAVKLKLVAVDQMQKQLLDSARSAATEISQLRRSVRSWRAVALLLVLGYAALVFGL